MTGLSKGSRAALTPALFAAVFVFHLWALMRAPAPFVDEAWNASRAWALIQTGEVFGTFDRGVLDRFEGHGSVPPWAPTLIQSLGLRLAGEPSLPAVRRVSLVFGMVLLVAEYSIAARLGGRGLGRMTVLLTSLSWPFLYSAHLARFDIYSAAFGLMAIALHLANRPARAAVSGLSGLALGLGFVMHPNAVIYAPAIGVLYFLEQGPSMFRRRHFWVFAAGAAAGPIFHVVRHVLPNPEIYSVLGQLGLGAGYLPPIATLDAGELGRSFSRTGGRLLLFYQALTPVVLCAAGASLLRRSRADQVLLTLAAVPVVSFALLIHSKATYYGIFLTPTVDLTVAGFLIGFFRLPWRGRFRDYAGRVLVWSACLSYAALNLLPLQDDQWSGFRSAQERITALIPAGATIMSVQTYWFGLAEHPYYSWEQLVYYRHYSPGSSLEDAFSEFRPDVFIVDRYLDYYIFDSPDGVSDPRDGGPLPYLWLPRSELRDFLDDHATRIDKFADPHSGPIRVYRLDWK